MSSSVLFPDLGPTAAPSSSPAEGPIVLLIEDEDSLAELLTHLLRRIQVKVLRAADGETARALFARNRDHVSMAIVDCHLPDVAGADLCHELRAAVPGLPLLISSGRDQRALEVALAAGGPCQFLAKPYMPAEVMRRVTALLAPSG